eukprot:13615-Heterococcus_DN1.PRE.1
MREHMLGQLEQTVAALQAASVDCGESHLTATSAATLDSLHRGLQELLAQFGPSCDERRSVMAYQFNQLDALLLPPYTRFVLWLMAQPDSFFRSGKAYCSSSSIGAGNCTPGRRSAAGAELAVKRAVLLLGDDAGATVDVTGASGNAAAAAAASAGAATPPLWALLCQELGLTAEQEDKLKACHVTAARDPRTKADRGTLRQLVQLVSELRAGCELYASSAQQRLQALTALLSPQQMVSYLAWVSKNRPAVRRCAEQLSAITAQHALGSDAAAAAAAAVGVTPLQMPVAQQQQVLQQQAPATLSPVSSHLLAFAEQQQTLLSATGTSAVGSSAAAAAAVDSMRDSSLSPPLLSLLPSSTAAADLQPIEGDQLTSNDVCVDSFATDFDSSVQLGADADINSDLLSFTEAFAGGGFADSSSSTAFAAGFPGLMDVSTDTLHSALPLQQQQQQSSGECSNSINNDSSSSSGSSESAKAKLLRLLNTADDQLSLSDMTWLMSWLKSNRAQRGASPLPDRPARRSDALLSSARALATGVCDAAAANASAQTSAAIAAAAAAADGNSSTVGLNGSSDSSVEALAALQQQQLQQQHRCSVIAEHSGDDDSNSDTTTASKRKSPNYFARSSG